MPNLVGQLSSWNYYETLDTPANKKFVADFKAKYRRLPGDLGSDGIGVHRSQAVEGGRREG